MTVGLPPIKVLETQTVGPGGAASVTLPASGTVAGLANFPLGSRHIVVLLSGASEDATSERDVELQFNGDTTATYNDQSLKGSNTTASGARGTAQNEMTVGVIPGTSVAATAFGGGWLLIPHAFNTTNHKAVLGLTGSAENSVYGVGGRWADASAITSINLAPDTGDFAEGTVVSLAVIDENFALPEEENILSADGKFAFDGLPIGRGDISVIGYLRSDASGDADDVLQELNEDEAGSAGGREIGEVPGDGATALAFGAVLYSIQQHSLGDNDPHTLSMSGFHEATGPDSSVQIISARLNAVAAVTKAEFEPSAGTNFKAGSMMTPYFSPKFQVGYAEADADVASFTFTLADLPIPPGVTDLRLNWYGRTDTAAATEGVDVEYNADTTAASYDVQTLVGDGGTDTAARSAADQAVGTIPGASATANIFGGGTLLIPAYAKTDRHDHRLYMGGAAEDNVSISSGRWETDGAITSITLTPSAGGNFVAGTIFELEAILPVGGEDRALSEGLGPGGYPQVFVDWDNDGVFSQANDEITSDVREISGISSGRNFASTQTGDAIAGNMRMVLDNSSGDYSPLNEFGVETGNIVPGRLVKVRMTAPFTRDFTMYLDTIIPRADLGTIPLADLVATGAIRKLNTEVNVALQKAVTTDAIVTEVLDEVEFSSTLRSLQTGSVTVTRWQPGRQSALSLIRQIEKSEDGFFYEDLGTGGVIFEERNHRLNDPHQFSQATFSDAQTAGSLGYRTVAQADVLKQVFTDLRAVVQVWPAAASLADLISHPHANTTGDAPTIAANGGTLAFILDIESDPDIDHVDAWTTPTLGASADIQVWSVNDGTGTNLSTSDISIAVVKWDTAIKITLTNNHATLAGFMTVCDVRGTSVARANPVTVFAQEASSAFGLIQLPPNAVARFIPDTATAQSILDAKLLVTKTPTAQTKIGGNPRESLAAAHGWLRREVSDRVTQVSTSSQTKLGINTEMYVESVKLAFGRERQTAVELGLFDTAGTSDIWVIGRSDLGTNTRVAAS